MFYTFTSASAFTCVVALYLVYKRFQRRISISHVRGPPSFSWLYGMPALSHKVHVRWKEIGSNSWKLPLERLPMARAIWRRRPRQGSLWGNFVYSLTIRLVSNSFLEDRLMITDPKAIQYVYHTASYRFPKPAGRSAIIRSLFGPGLTVSEVARKLVEEKTAALLEGKSRLDIFSLLVKANYSEQTETRLKEKEVLGEIKYDFHDSTI
ncbi:hypothetical protein BDZ89DRAFT_1134927 [Hymenopellis radicata]|nr:hypothetical protein BDZ89DRAFT_1134927 [Hymenopellis radicata]